MEGTQRTYCNCGKSDSESLQRYTRETSDFSENNSLEEINKDVESIEDQEECAEELSDYDCQGVHEPVFENMGPNVDKVFKTMFKFDGVMKTSPKVSREPSVEEGLPKVFETTTRGESCESNVMWNTKALPREARTYQLEKFQKNCLIIFNQESIDGFEERKGTAYDVNVLTKTFKNFGFDVVEHKDFTKERIIEVLETFKTTDFTEYGCVGVVVLTHGTFNDVLRAKDQAYSETEILKYFRVYDKPTLVTKPKLLIIQACRGTRCLPGVLAHEAYSPLRTDVYEEVEPYTLPAMADVLIVHSSYSGETSIRDELNGSWLIQTLCEKINRLASTHDLESILTEMKHEVALHKEMQQLNRATQQTDIFKQMPTVISTLTRKLYLRKFGDEAPPMTFSDNMPMTPAAPTQDTAADSTDTTLLYQLGPCSCFLQYFEYLKKCLTHFVEENPTDEAARHFLEISNTFEDEDHFNAAKVKMARAIIGHLTQHARHCDFYKYLNL